MRRRVRSGLRWTGRGEAIEFRPRWQIAIRLRSETQFLSRLLNNLLRGGDEPEEGRGARLEFARLDVFIPRMRLRDPAGTERDRGNPVSRENVRIAKPIGRRPAAADRAKLPGPRL